MKTVDHLFIHCSMAFDWVLKEMGYLGYVLKIVGTFFSLKEVFWGKGRDGKNYGMLHFWLGHYDLREMGELLKIKKAIWSLYGRELNFGSQYGSLKLKNLKIFCFQI